MRRFQNEKNYCETLQNKNFENSNELLKRSYVKQLKLKDERNVKYSDFQKKNYSILFYSKLMIETFKNKKQSFKDNGRNKKKGIMINDYRSLKMEKYKKERKCFILFYN